MKLQVYSASKHYQDVSEAPSSVSVVTAEEIERLGYRTLAELLGSLNGFFVTNDRNYSYVGVRGFSPPGDFNGRILVLVDGHRLNENVLDEALIGAEFPVDLDQVERVEVVRGPSSSLYGTSAFFAVINVITKKRSAVKHGRLSVEGGSFGAYKGHFSYGTTLLNRIDTYLAGAIYDSMGNDRLYYREFDTSANNNGFALHCDDETSKNFLANFAYDGFRLQGVYGSREKGIPTASYGTLFNDPRTRTLDTQAYVDLTFERELKNNWSVMSRVAYDRYTYEGNYAYAPDAFGTPGDVVNRDFSQGDWVTAEGQLNKRVGQRHRVTVGTEFRDNVRQNQQNYNVSPYALFLNSVQDSTIWAVYAQDEFKIATGLVLNAGVRHDQYSTFGGTTNPRLGLIYSPFEKTQFKLLYGRAFRAPTVYELFYETPGSSKSNPYLRPESISTYELAFTQHVGQHVSLNSSGYEYRVSNLIAQQVDPTDGLLFYQNAQRIKARGLEFEAEGKWSNGMEARLSYAVQKSEDAQTGLNVANSPKHLGKSTLILPLAKQRMFLGIEGQYTSARQSLAGGTIGGFVTANVTVLARHLAKGWEVSGSIYNLFDKNYADPGAQEHLQDAIRQDGRSFRLKVSYGF